MRGQGLDPPLTVRGRALPGRETEIGGDRLAGAGDVPRFEPEPSQHLVELPRGRRINQVASYRVAGAGLVEQRQGRPAFGACRVDPDFLLPRPSGGPYRYAGYEVPGRRRISVAGRTVAASPSAVRCAGRRWQVGP